MGKLYADRRAALLRGLDTIDGATVSGAEGGIHFLLTLPRFSEAELLSRAAAAGIPLKGLSEYCRNSPPLPSTLVIGYGGLPTAQVETVVQMLRQAWSAPN